MERAFAFFCRVVFVLSILVFAGCKDEETIKILSSNGITLSVFPHTCFVTDSSSGTITATVRNMNNQPVAGEPLTVSLADTHAGEIRFFLETLRDTTSSRGEILFSYLNRRGGDNVITVSARGVADSCSIAIVIPIDDPPSLLLTVNPDTLYVPEGGEDSARVAILLKDRYSTPIQNCNVFLSTNGGWISFILLTDSLGQASTWWHTNGLYGTFYIVSFANYVMDTTWVTVLP